MLLLVADCTVRYEGVGSWYGTGTCCNGTTELAYLASRQKCRAAWEPSQYKADTRTLLELAVRLELLKHTKSPVWEEQTFEGRPVFDIFLRPLLGAFERPLAPSVRSHGTTQLPLDGFWLNLMFRLFRKSVETVQVSLKSDKNNGYFTRIRFHIYDNIFVEWELF